MTTTPYAMWQTISNVKEGDLVAIGQGSAPHKQEPAPSSFAEVLEIVTQGRSYRLRLANGGVVLQNAAAKLWRRPADSQLADTAEAAVCFHKEHCGATETQPCQAKPMNKREVKAAEKASLSTLVAAAKDMQADIDKILEPEPTPIDQRALRIEPTKVDGKWHVGQVVRARKNRATGRHTVVTYQANDRWHLTLSDEQGRLIEERTYPTRAAAVTAARKGTTQP